MGQQKKKSMIDITQPFPRDDNGEHQSVPVGETRTSSFVVCNGGEVPVHLQAVRIAAFGSLRAFHNLRMLEGSSTPAPRERRLDIILSNNRILRPGEQLSFSISCSPRQVGFYQARILCDFQESNLRVVRHISVLGDDEWSSQIPKTGKYSPQPRRKWKPGKIINSVPPPAPKFANRLKPYRLPDVIRSQIQNKEVPPVLSEGLSKATYAEYFDVLLHAEEYQMEIDIEEYNMEGVTMRHTNDGQLALKVPGLVEKRPSVIYRDCVYCRKAGSQGNEYQGYVYQVLRNEVYLKFHSSFRDAFITNSQFDVRFTFNRVSLQQAHQALEFSAGIDRFLWPAAQSQQQQKLKQIIKPFNRLLNTEQINAVSAIVQKKGGPPYIIYGPPGTGKTVTLIEAIRQIRSCNSSAIILVCAPSNSASDLLLERLIGSVPRGKMLRLNAYTRSRHDIPPAIVDYCNSVTGCPSREELEAFQVIVCTFSSAAMLHAQDIKPGHFSHILLDEAGQATEPETLIPVATLAARDTVLVLAGDHKQLGPMIGSPVALEFGLDKSFIERLISSPPFAATGAAAYRRDLVTKLLRNYRSHPAILALPSRLFYENELIPSAGEFAHSLCNWNYLPNKKFPMLFIGVEGMDEQEQHSPSWFNRQEASKVIEVVKSLRDHKVLAKDIGIVTPYRKQVSKIKVALKVAFGNTQTDATAFKVGTVELFQGQEKRVIIVSTVRTTKEMVDFDEKHNLGFLVNPKRFNVTITRAMALMVVIGHPAVLRQDPQWKELMLYCRTNNSYRGCPFPPENNDKTLQSEYDAEIELTAEDQAWPEAVYKELASKLSKFCKRWTWKASNQTKSYM